MATGKKNKEKDLKNKQELVEEIQNSTKELLLPTLQQKSLELSDKIVELLSEHDINNTQILSMIARKSINEIAMSTYQISYTPQEIMIGFNLYLDMINKINEVKNFPPTVENYCMFMGISRTTYNNWLVDPEKKDVMDYIHSYLLGVLAVGGLTGETREISSMFLAKTMGKIEAQQQITVKHEITTDVDDINKQLQALKQEKVIEAEYEEKD